MGQGDADETSARGAGGSTRVVLGDETLVHGAGAEAEIDAPAQIGRYRVLRELGKGGMGVVYEAHDPVLDRAVAIKLVRAGRHLRGTKARARLIREAQTIAQLSHPNVVAVFEVGTHGDELFIAMELVDGLSLRAWLTKAPRTPKEILAVLEQAGLGLAAAHESGVVHRDFKPDNVMVTPARRGVPLRVRVLDFGLARAGDLASSEASEHMHGTSAGDAPLTQTGFAMGTPAYMAPEQFVGTRVSPASDQFAFCVVAIEALAGKRPFTGGTLDELARQTHKGELDAAAMRGLPQRLAGALRRGLAREPAQRWPDMPTLLSALRDDGRRWRRALAIGAVVSATAGLALAELRAPTCPSEAELRAGLWDAHAHAELRAVFDAIGTRAAASTWAAVQGELDRRADAWIAASISGCRSASAQGECLAERRAELETAIETLHATTRAELHNALHVLEALPEPTACDTAETTSPALLEARRRLSSAQALAALGKDRAAEAELERVSVPGSADPGAAAVEAERERLRGRLLARKGDEQAAIAALEAAYFAALRSHRDPLAVVAAADLAAAGAVGYRERWQWAHHAAAALARTDLRDAAAAYDRAMCRLQRDSGALDEAADHCARALAASEGSGLVDEHIAALLELADLHTAADRLQAAHELYTEALALAERSWDAEHPGIADALDQLAHAELRLDRPERARALAERALDLRERSGDDSDPLRAKTLHVIASIELWEKHGEAARVAAARALALRRAALGEQHREVALSWYQLALAEEELGRTGDALVSMSRCAEIEEELHPLDITRIPTLRELARMAYTFGAGPKAGLEHLERAWAIVHESGVPMTHPLVKDLDHGYGETLLALGRADEGVPYLERFVADERPSPILAHVQFVLARALWMRDKSGDRGRAVEMVERAIVEIGSPRREFDVDQLAAMRAWLGDPQMRDHWREGVNWRGD